MDSDELIVSAGVVFFNTNLAAAVATLTTMCFTWIRYGKPDVSMTFNAALAGLVGITAGCDAVNPSGAAGIGVLCGLAVVLAVEFFDKTVKIDDPVGAISVHGVCGALGTVLTGVFATGRSTMKGVLYGGGLKFLGIQTLGVASTIAWTTAVITLVFSLIRMTIGLRASSEEEIMGLDRSECGLHTAYAGFTILHDGAVQEPEIPAAPLASEEKPAAVRNVKQNKDAAVYTSVRIICRPGSLERLKAAMNQIGITGMTVTNVMGYGAQKGKPEYYRGTPVDVTLLPKVQVDIVVSKVPVRQVIETAKLALHTGHIGDGKIFVTDVENVVRIRTGEEGYDALQSEEE
jgi:Amt family ammonium transporter